MLTVSQLHQKAIDFSLPDQDGKKVSLSDFRGKWIVLYFYPKDNTPGCTIEAIHFTKEMKEFTKRGAVILGVSPDSPQSHCNFIKKQKLRLELLSDEKKTVLKKYGVWGRKKFMGREYLGVLRTTLLIDPNGRIMHVWNDVKVKGHAEEVLAELKRRKD